MIPLTRIKGRSVAINPDLIEWVEETPDTTIRLSSGEKILVRETLSEVVDRVIGYRKALVRAAANDPLCGLSIRQTTPCADAPVHGEEG